MASLVVLLCASWGGCISCVVGVVRDSRNCCGSLTVSQAIVSQLEMVFASVSLFSKVFMNCMNNIGVFSKNCLMCSRRFHHSCRGVLRTEVHSDLAFAIAKTIPSFVITSDVQSLRWALGNCAGNLGMARGRAYRSMSW